jgi:hypothetical protein
MNTLRFSLRASVLLAALSPLVHADSLTVEGDLKTTGNVTVGTVSQTQNLTVTGDVAIAGILEVDGQPVVTVDQLVTYATTSQLTGYVTTTQLSSAGYLTSSGSGASLTNLNAAALSTGTISVDRLPAAVSQLGATIELNGAETTGNLDWARVAKTGSSLVDLASRNFAALQNTPTTLVGYGITDAVAKDGSGNVAVTGTLTVGGQTVATANQLTGFATTSQLSGYLATNGSGANLTNLNAAALSSGTIPSGVLPVGVTQLGNTIELGSETTGQLAWASVAKTSSTLADLETRNYTDLQNIPSTLAGHGITDAVQKNTNGDVVIAGSTTLTGAVTINGVATVNRRVAKLRVEQQGDLDMGTFTAGSTIP